MSVSEPKSTTAEWNIGRNRIESVDNFLRWCKCALCASVCEYSIYYYEYRKLFRWLNEHLNWKLTTGEKKIIVTKLNNMRDSFYSFQFIKTLCFNWLGRHTPLTHTKPRAIPIKWRREKQINEKQMVHSEANWSWLREKVIFQICQRFFCMRAYSSTFEHSLFSDIQFIGAVLPLALHNPQIYTY